MEGGGGNGEINFASSGPLLLHSLFPSHFLPLPSPPISVPLPTYLLLLSLPSHALPSQFYPPSKPLLCYHSTNPNTSLPIHLPFPHHSHSYYIQLCYSFPI